MSRLMHIHNDVTHEASTLDRGICARYTELGKAAQIQIKQAKLAVAKYLKI